MSEEPHISLSNSDIVGAVQRMLMELNNYLNQPVERINPQMGINHLHRCVEFLGKLPASMAVPNGAGEAPEQRAN